MWKTVKTTLKCTLNNLSLQEQNLRSDGYVVHDQNYLCKKESTTTTCFCTGTGCNDEANEPNPRPEPTSGASRTVAGAVSMAGLLLLAWGA